MSDDNEVRIRLVSSIGFAGAYYEDEITFDRDEWNAYSVEEQRHIVESALREFHDENDHSYFEFLNPKDDPDNREE